MKKLLPVVIVGIVVVLALGYLGRHKIKSMLMGSGTETPTTNDMVVSSPSSAAGVPSNNIYLTKTDATKGNYMTDSNGMTLYTFNKDTSGVSNCTGQCLVAWPPYTSGAVNQSSFPADISVITGSDGTTKQFAWKGMPLYYFKNDAKAGDITGDGVNGFSIVKL